MASILTGDDSPARSVSLCATRRLQSFCVAQCILSPNDDAISLMYSHTNNSPQKCVSFVYIGNDRYDVYANLEAEAAFLKLNDNGVHLLQLQAAFAKLQVPCVCLDIALCPVNLNPVMLPVSELTE